MNQECLHWSKINKDIVMDVWDNLSDEARDIIASDTLHTSDLLSWITAHCVAETNKLFNNPDLDYNDPFFFAHRRRIRKGGKKHLTKR